MRSFAQQLQGSRHRVSFMEQEVVLALGPVELAVQHVGCSRLLCGDVHLRLQLDDLRAFLQQRQRNRDGTQRDQDQPRNPAQKRPDEIRRIVVRKQVDREAVTIGQRRLHAGDRQACCRRGRDGVGDRRLRRNDETNDQLARELVASDDREVESNLVGPERRVAIELVEERVTEVVFRGLRDRQRLRQVLARGQTDSEAVDARVP